MNSVAVLAVVAGAVLVLALLGGLALSATRVSNGGDFAVGDDAPRADPPSDGSYGLVVAVYRAKAGFGVFGWEIIDSEYEAQVMFVPPAGCTPPESGDLAAEGACANVPAAGRIGGGGITAEGHRLVAVATAITKACHDALALGDRWPPVLPECAE
jgi:hypothetical protein